MKGLQLTRWILRNHILFVVAYLSLTILLRLTFHVRLCVVYLPHLAS